jgi:hypothetical protein
MTAPELKCDECQGHGCITVRVPCRYFGEKDDDVDCPSCNGGRGITNGQYNRLHPEYDADLDCRIPCGKYSGWTPRQVEEMGYLQWAVKTNPSWLNGLLTEGFKKKIKMIQYYGR